MPVVFFRMAIDSHCHLTLRFERDEVRDVLARATGAGVNGVVLIGYCPMHNRKVCEILDDPGLCGPDLPAKCGTVGVHPHEADKFGPREVEDLRGYLERLDIVAIGETGLDFFRDYADRGNQEALFQAEVQLASESCFPLVVHSRDSFDRTMGILTEFKLPNPPGVFHCFGYGPRELEKVIEMGFFVSFAGNLTYPKSVDLHDARRSVPMNRILVETDSPFQVPQKAKNRKVNRNEPAYVAETIGKVAELRNQDREQVETALISNTLECFPRLKNIRSWADLVSRKSAEVSG